MYELNGKTWTVDDIQSAADRNNLSYDDAFDQLTKAGMTKAYSLDPTFAPVESGYFAKPASVKKTSEEIKKEQDAIKAGRINLLLDSNVPIEIAVALEPIVGISAGFSSAIPRLAGGLVEGVDSFWQPVVALATGKSLREVDEMGYDIPGEKLLEIANELSALQSTFYDEKGQQEELIDLIKGERYGDAGIMAAEQLFANIPQLAISFRMPKAGGALLGASVYGEEFSRQQKERLDQDMSKVYLNSFMKGASEFGTEYLGGKIGRYASGLSRSGLTQDALKDFTKNAFVNALAKAGIGFTGEALTEGATGVFQTFSDQIVFNDEKSTQEYFRRFVNDALIGGLLGGTVSGVTFNANRPTKENIYQLLAPKEWQQEQLAISKKIEKAEAELETADEIAKPIIQKQIDNLKKVEKDNLNKLYSSFDNLTKQELEAYAINFDRIQELEKIITGGKKYSDSTKELAETELLQVYATLNGLIGKNVNIDIETELELGRTIRNYQNILKERGRFGFSQKDLDIEYLETTDQVDKLIESRPDLSDINAADGMFLTQNKETGKKTIYINMPVASITGQTNVLGHEYLHYIISRAFKTDAENLTPAVKAFFDYVKSVDSDLATRIEDKLANNYGKIIGYQKSKNNEDIPIRVKRYNSDGLLDLEKQEYIEEYFNIFSDLTKNKKIDKVEEKTTGLANSFRTLMRGLGFGKVDFTNGKEIFDFIQDYNTNLSREGVIGKIAAKRISKVKLTGLKAADKQATKPQAKESRTYKKTDRDVRIDKLGEQYTKEEYGSAKDNKPGKGTDVYFELYASGDLEAMVRGRITDEMKRTPGFLEEDFINETIVQLKNHIENFDVSKKKTEEGFGLSGWIRSQVGNKIGDVLKKGVVTEEKFTSDIQESTEAQVVAAEEADLEVFEMENLSPEAQLAKNKEKQERQSKLRRKLGFETGGEMYNKVLNSAKKSVLIAYRKTQSIKDPAQRAKAIKDLLRKEYFTSGLTSDLFKSTKNFLGKKDYIKNLKQYREAIIESLSTADLVQMERNIPDTDRVFTFFVEKLTKIEDVESAVRNGLLPTEAINAIRKGQAVNLYRKRMPTEMELVSFADQPAINPTTGQRSGLKGTRKDGFAKAIANTMVLDAVMEVRQSEDVVEALEDDAIAQLDLMALSDAVGREVDVKFSKSTAVVDINNAIDNNINLAVYSQIKFSRSHREAYEARLAKKRTDLDEKQIKGAVESIFKFVEGDNIPNNKKAKYEKMAMHYMANGYLILPEDGYKVIEAERIATIKKIDPFSYKNPNELIEKFAGEVKGARINPDTVKEFTNKTDVGQDVTVYDVEYSKEGQLAVRKVVDTHFGKKADPWCLVARMGGYYASDQAYSKQERDQMIADQEAVGRYVEVTEYKEDGQTVYELTIYNPKDSVDSLDSAYDHWKSYNKKGNGFKIAFKNGKLLCFRDGNEKRWWDRNDKPSDKIHFIVTEKKGDVESTYSVIPEDGTKTLTKRIKGKMPNAEVFYISDDNNYNIKSNTTYVDGAITKQRIETIFKDSRLAGTIFLEKQMGQFQDIQLSNMTKDIEVIDGNISTRELKGKVVLTSKQFKQFEDKTVEIEHVTNTQTSETISLTINGAKQDIGVKFSKSAAEVNYNKALNNIKFSLTSAETKRKLQPYLAKRLSDVKELGFTTDQIIYSTLQEEIKRGTELKDAYAIAFNKAFADQANEIINMDENTVLDLEGLNILENNIKEFYLPKIREFAQEVALKKYAQLIKNAKGDVELQQEIINNFLINFGRPIRSAKVFYITTNKKLLNEMKKAFGKEAMKPYSLEKVQSGQKVMLNGKDIDLYKSITPIKADPARYADKINEQALLSKEFLFEKILGDETLSDGEKKALVQLIFYGQKGPGRKLYKLGTYVENMPVAETTLEHEITADDMHSAIIDVIDGKMDIDELSDIIDNAYVHVLPKKINDIFKKLGKTSSRNLQGYNSMPEVLEYLQTLNLKGNTGLFDFSNNEAISRKGSAIKFSRSVNKLTKGITVLDFDDTLATSKSLVKFTRPDGTKGTLTPEQYAATYEDLSDLGYKFDFSEFSKVVDGKPAPLLNKAKKLASKFGTENMFILTARPADSAPAIREFLKQNGLDIPLKNITGLGNSTAEAKALWMADKVADGYNDFYFADDALKNVQAVDDVLSQLGVKRKVQQAKVKFSKSLSKDLTKNKSYKKFRNSLKGSALYHGGTASLSDNKAVWFIVSDKDGAELYAERRDGKVYSIDSNDLNDAVIIPDVSDLIGLEKVIKNKYKSIAKEVINEYGQVDIKKILETDVASDVISDFMDYINNNFELLEGVYGPETLYDNNGKISKGVPVIVLGGNVSTKVSKVKFSKSIQTIPAVANILDQFDVKSKVQQARVKFSKSLSSELNKMIERNKGFKAEQVFDEATAKQLGKDKGKYEFFISAGADDFQGLMMRLAGKGEQGNRDMQFFKETLFDPFNKAYREMNEYAYVMLNDLDALIKEYPDVRKRFKQPLEGTDFDTDQAIRIYLWHKNGQDIPGLSDKQAANISSKVASDSRLVEFATKLNKIPKLRGEYTKPGENWTVENIKADIYNAVENSRAEFLLEWQENADALFTQENLNKLEAVYGSDYVDALKNILHRMKTGRNRVAGKDKEANKLLNWINNSVGAIMFFNSRSAVLQTLSIVNFIDYENNNIFAAGKAFANQKQYWKDFSFLFNSPTLKMRRAGVQTDVSASDIAEAVKGKRNPAKAAIAYLLKVGFTPTQIADSFAISAGGATYYRNQVNFYIKEGMSRPKAEEKAFADFQSKTEEAQQSSRPDRISRQQASVLGRLILAFQNTPMQYNRIIKKSVLDIVNGRGALKSNISKILYYGTAQGLIFNALQNAIFALDFDDDEEKMTDKELEKAQKFKEKKYNRILDGMISSLLRGSGLKGAYIDTVYKTVKEFQTQRAKGWKADHAETFITALNVSPPIGSKFRKLYSAIKSDKFNKDIYDHMSYGDINHPIYDVATSAIEAVTNAPTQRMHRKIININDAFRDHLSVWQRAFLLGGWNRWSLGIEEGEEKKQAIEAAKQEKKEVIKKRKPKKGEKRCGAITSSGKRCKNMTDNASGLCYAHD